LGRVIGVLIFISRKRGAYGDQDLEVAQEISDRFGIVVDHTLRRRSANQTDDEVTQSFINVIRGLAQERVGHEHHSENVLAERMAAKLVAYLPDEMIEVGDRISKTGVPKDYFDRGLPNGLQPASSRQTFRGWPPGEMFQHPRHADSHALSEELTSRERDVLGLVARGFRNKEIGQQLGLGESTVKFHLGHIFEKLGVSSRTEAVMMALRLGILAPP
jgi:DNA-binding NarL/FixJ family response regulator